MGSGTSAFATLGITPAAGRGIRTVYRYEGQSGLDELSIGARVTSADPGRFRARLVSVPLEEIAFEDFTTSGYDFVRRASDIGQVPADAVRVSFMMEGTVALGEPNGEILVSPGQLFSIDMSRPVRASFASPSRQLSVVIPTRLLRAVPGKLDVMHQEVLPRSPLAMLFMALVKELTVHAPDDNTLDSELLSHALIDMSQALARTRGHGVDGTSEDDHARRRIYELIERDFADPDLGAEAIARRMRLSTRAVYRLFAEEPLSISQAIRHRRVQAIADELIGTSVTFETIAARAGFGSSHSAYRSFRDLKGVAPSDYRRRRGSGA